jgi:hypothetical protein
MKVETGQARPMTMWISFGLLVALAATGCSSSYEPAKSPLIATAWRNGYPSYYRDGKEYPSGLLLDGVEDAVQGNPRAQEEARAAHHLMIGGLVFGVAGLGALGAGVAVAASNPSESPANEVALGLLIGSIAANLTAAVLFANAYPHAYDAVNIYNDSIKTTSRSSAPSGTVSTPSPLAW